MLRSRPPSIPPLGVAGGKGKMAQRRRMGMATTWQMNYPGELMQLEAQAICFSIDSRWESRTARVQIAKITSRAGA